MSWTETPVSPNPWVSTAGEPPSVWTPSPTCGVTVDVTVQQKTQTLYYIAATGQRQFSLSAADMFDNNVFLTSATALAVSKGGLRLVPDDGSGAGGYTVDLANNTINLLWPAGDGEILIVDLFWEDPEASAPVVFLPSTIYNDVLTVTALNTLSALARMPDGQAFVLFVEGRAFFAPASFTIAGTLITWTSTLYSLQPGNEVVAIYSSGGASPPPQWWLGLPTTLPPIAGVLWNNGGVICVS